MNKRLPFFLSIRKTLTRWRANKGLRDIYYPSEKENEIRRFRLLGSSEVDDSGNFIGVGDKQNGNTVLPFHIHSGCIISGRAFCEMINSKLGCGIDNGDSMTFTFTRDMNDTVLITNEEIKFLYNTPYTFFLDVDFLENVNNTNYCGLKFNYVEGSGNTILLRNSADMRTCIVKSTSEYNHLKSILVNCPYDVLQVKIYYDTSGIMKGIFSSAESFVPYCGEHVNLSLTSPLFSVNGVCDEIDFLENKVIRRTATCDFVGEGWFELLEYGTFHVPISKRCAEDVEIPLICNSLEYKPYDEIMTADSGIAIEPGGEAFIIKDPAHFGYEEDFYLYCLEHPIRTIIVLPDFYEESLSENIPLMSDGCHVDFHSEVKPSKIYTIYKTKSETEAI